MTVDKERMTIYIPCDTKALLRDYAYHSGIRTPNEAAVSIISQHLREWGAEFSGPAPARPAQPKA